MTGRMAGKVAIVTGGNSGMGAGTVELFVAEGARVVIAARGEEAGQALADRLGENAVSSAPMFRWRPMCKRWSTPPWRAGGGWTCCSATPASGKAWCLPEEFTPEDFNRVDDDQSRLLFSSASST